MYVLSPFDASAALSAGKLRVNDDAPSQHGNLPFLSEGETSLSHPFGIVPFLEEYLPAFMCPALVFPLYI